MASGCSGQTDRVIRATKTALDSNGYTIPWPIRTLVMDDVVTHRAESPD